MDLASCQCESERPINVKLTSFPRGPKHSCWRRWRECDAEAWRQQPAHPRQPTQPHAHLGHGGRVRYHQSFAHCAPVSPHPTHRLRAPRPGIIRLCAHSVPPPTLLTSAAFQGTVSTSGVLIVYQCAPPSHRRPRLTLPHKYPSPRHPLLLYHSFTESNGIL